MKTKFVWMLALALCGGLISCSESESTEPISNMYRVSDNYRSTLESLGCDVARMGHLGGQASVECAETESMARLSERAQVLKSWGEYLQNIIDHPHLPAASQSSYESLQNLLLTEADEIAVYVETMVTTQREKLELATETFESWRDAAYGAFGALYELGCDFLADPKGKITAWEGDGEPPACDYYHATQKIQILADLTELSEMGAAVARAAEEMPFQDDVKELQKDVVAVTRALSTHLAEQQDNARLEVQRRRLWLRADYGFEIQTIFSSRPPVTILLPEGKRTQEAVDELVAELKEYLVVAYAFLEYEPLGLSSGTIRTEKDRVDILENFLKGPLTLEYLLEAMEPEPEPERAPLSDPQPPSIHYGDLI